MGVVICCNMSEAGAVFLYSFLDLITEVIGPTWLQNDHKIAVTRMSTARAGVA